MTVNFMYIDDVYKLFEQNKRVDSVYQDEQFLYKKKLEWKSI